MKKKLSVLIVLVCILALALVGCANGREMKFYTGGDQGTYYSFGEVIAEHVKEDKNLSLLVETSGGSQDNLENIESGKAQFAWTQSDVMAYAYNGTRLFANGDQITNFSVLGSLYSEEVQIVTCDPTIQSVDDLKGKTVSIGESGSGVYYNAMDVLEAYDISESQITPVYQGFGESTESLADGTIDAAFVVAGAPAQAITVLSETADIYIVSLDEDHINALKEISPYYGMCVIGSDVYGTDDDILTVDVDAILIASDDVSDDDAYDLVSSIFDDVSFMEEAHEKGAELNLEDATSVTTVPYHPGAAKYYEEQGYSVPTK
ncbi:MAG: TAXI family TRAP transporter solute-binding subunit [Lachnospiraceae bacterium]|nr:TAXI family TRAP transporter solute-binding subunit [Lachnospiraceae bacterium]